MDTADLTPTALPAPTLSVVIPAYNEEAGIAEIVQRVLAIRPDLARAGVPVLELLVVDDGSADRTVEVLRDYAQVRRFEHGANKGYGAALKTGFAAAQGELLGFLDADGTYPPEYFPRLCEQAINGADLVVGSRRSGEASQMPFLRRVGNLVWSNLVSILGGSQVIDPASGMRVFKRAALERLYPLPDGLNLTPIMSTRAVQEGLDLVEVPIPYAERRGRSKLSVVRDGSLFLYSIIWTILTYNPARVLGMIGFSGVVAAVLIGLGFVLARIGGITTIGPGGLAVLFAGVVAGFAGVSIFSLGITFNYLVSLFTGRPVRQGLFGRPIFKTPLDRQFGWIGMLATAAGAVLGLVSLWLGLQGWEIARLWLYLLASAMFVLLGLQLIIYWILLRVLAELSDRESLVQQDLGTNPGNLNE